MNLESYVGQTINELEVLKLLPKNAHGDHKYLVRCSCGVEFSAGVYNVQRGNTKSCGAQIHKIGMGFKRQPDDKLIAAYYRNLSEAKAIREAFEARGLALPVSTENGQSI
jgi:hypothetical protein